MPERPFNPDIDDDKDLAPKRGWASGISRWQKVIGLIALIIVLAIVILQVSGVGGDVLGHTPEPGPPAGGH